MRVLALDYGAARIGCAVSDPTGTLATPIEPVSPPDAAVVARLVEEREVELVVVGMPVSLSGERGAQAEATDLFRRELTDLVRVPVETYDERFTTRMAAQTRRASGSSSSEDSIAAAHLLESYLAAAEARAMRAGAELEDDSDDPGAGRVA